MRNPEFQLRAADAGDLAAIFDMFVQVQSIHAEAEPDFFRPPERDEAFEQYYEGIMNDPEQFLVIALSGGAAAGHVQYFMGTRPKSIYRPERRFAYIHQLVVSEDFRRTGCGTALIDHVKQDARKQGIAMLGIDFWSFNGPARRCFESAGFKVNQEHMWQRL